VLSEYLPDSGGGIISYYAGVLPPLVAAGHRVDVLVAAADKLDRPETVLGGVRVRYLKSATLARAAAGWERYRIGYPTFAAFLPLAWAAYEEAGRGAGYDLVETTDFPLLFAPWVVSTDSPPVVVALHGSCGQLEWHEHPERVSLDADLLRLVERAALACAPAIYGNSETNARFWRAATRREVGLLPPAFYGEVGAPVAARRPVGTGVVAGRCQNWKGPHVLCEALKLLPGVKVRWFGRDVVDAATGLSQAEFLQRKYPGIIGTQLILEGAQPRERVYAEIAGAAFLCVPSEWDVFNLTVVEAMALGAPVICSLRAGAAMLIKHGENGFLFDPAVPAQLAAAIQAVLALGEPARRRLVEQARATLQTRLDPATLTAERVAYYDGVIRGVTPWRVDDWLRLALAPRPESEPRGHGLRAYTVRELAGAAARQLLAGVRRRLGRSAE